MTSILAETAAAWGLPLSSAQLDQFACYSAELRRWNERLNLTAITDPEQIAVRHFLDSLRCALLWGNAPTNLIDVGTGAGFPGLPLKLLRPDLQLTLVESVAKKTAFLSHLVAELGLEKTEVLTARAEQLGQNPQHREKYDLVTARAVAALSVLAEYCLPLCRIGGRFLAPKGGQIADEVALAMGAIEHLGGQLLELAPVLLPGVEPRTIAVIAKAVPTPPTYPRRVGVASRRPL